jgi:hypothetical protein
VDGAAGEKEAMQGSIRVRLEELAELRDKAELLCEETKEIIDEYRRLKAWLLFVFNER